MAFFPPTITCIKGFVIPKRYKQSFTSQGFFIQTFRSWARRWGNNFCCQKRTLDSSYHDSVRAWCQEARKRAADCLGELCHGWRGLRQKACVHHWAGDPVASFFSSNWCGCDSATQPGIRSQGFSQVSGLHSVCFFFWSVFWGLFFWSVFC